MFSDLGVFLDAVTPIAWWRRSFWLHIRRNPSRYVPVLLFDHVDHVLIAIQRRFAACIWLEEGKTILRPDEEDYEDPDDVNL